MIPGFTTKLTEEVIASAATIAPRADLVRLTGTVTLAQINGQFGGGFSGVLFIVPVDGAVTTTTTGNILAVQSMLQNRVAILVFSKGLNKWVQHALA